MMNETFPIGKYLKVFMSNGFKYEGKILRLNRDETILTFEDRKDGKERNLIIAQIVDFQINDEVFS